MADDFLPIWLARQLDVDEMDLAQIATWGAGSDRIATMQGTTALMSAKRAIEELKAKRMLLGMHAGTVTKDGRNRDVYWCYICDHNPAHERGSFPQRSSCLVVRIIALPYAARPGFQDDWRPTEDELRYTITGSRPGDAP